MRFLPGRSFVAGGDLNAARLFGEVYGGCSEWGGNALFFDRIENNGFANCMSRFHDEEVQTYFKEGKGPYQLDHLHASPALADTLESCRVVTHPVTRMSLSDHAPIVADFGIDTPTALGI